MSRSAIDTQRDAPETISERVEMRLVGRALTHWERLRGAREFPCYADYQDGSAPYDDSNIFVIRIRDSELADEIVQAGAAITTALGRDPLGCKAIEVLPSSTEMGLSYCRAAAEMKKPIADVGQFTNAKGEEVRYRSILLPLSDDQEKVDHVLGAFSFKFLT